MAPGATRIHEEKPGNVIVHSSFTVGDGTYEVAVKEEGEENLIQIDKDYKTQSVQHCHLELPVSFAYMEKDRIIVTTSTQIQMCIRDRSVKLQDCISQMRTLECTACCRISAQASAFPACPPPL